MPLDDSAVSAAGLLHSALILTSHAISAMSKSENPRVVAKHGSMRIIEEQVAAILADISKTDSAAPAPAKTKTLGEAAAIISAAPNPVPSSATEQTQVISYHQVAAKKLKGTLEESDQMLVSRNIPEPVKFAAAGSKQSSSSSSWDDGLRVKAMKGTLLQRLRKETKHRDNMIRAQEAFRALDTDGSGFLDENELRRAFFKVGIKDYKVDDAISQLSQAVEGHDKTKVDLNTFVKFMNSEQNAEAFNEWDTAFNSVTDELVSAFNERSEEMVIGDSKFLLDPRSRLSINWDIAVGLLLVLTVITMPLSMAFELAQKPLKPLDVMADVIFIMDITKHFNSGYIDEYEFIIMDSKKVRSTYFYGWFFPDMMSSLPVELLDVAFTGLLPSNLKATKALKLLRLSRLAKVFRILKLPKLAKLLIDLQDGIEDHFEFKFDESKIAIASLFMGLLVVAHWVGCISFMLAAEFGFPEDSWVVNAGLVDQPLGTQYSWSIFKALMTMIGAGFEDPPIVNTVCTERTTWCTIEHWNTLICLYIGSVFYALLIASVSDIMAMLNKGGSALADQLWGLNEYLSFKKVPISMKNRVRNFYRIQYADGKMYDETKLLEALPPKIRDDIVTYIHKDLFKKVPLLSLETTPKSFMAKLAPALSARVAFRGEEIIKEDTTGDEMFFINSGIVQILSKHCEFVVKALADGCYFGDVAVLLGCKRTATIKARTITSLYALTRESLLAAFTDLPRIYKTMMDTASKRRKRMLLLDESSTNLDYNEEDIEDEEDASTKYFVDIKYPKEAVGAPYKVPSKKHGLSFNNVTKLLSRISSSPMISSSKGQVSDIKSSDMPQVWRLDDSYRSADSTSSAGRGARRRQELFPTQTEVRRKVNRSSGKGLENGGANLSKRIDLQRGDSISSIGDNSGDNSGDNGVQSWQGSPSRLNLSGGIIGRSSITVDRPPEEQDFDPLFHPENIQRRHVWSLTRTNSGRPVVVDEPLDSLT